MKLLENSFVELANRLQEVLGKFVDKGDYPVVTDIYFKPIKELKELVVYDDDNQLFTLSVNGMDNILEKEFYPTIENELRRVLLEVDKRISFNDLHIWKPYSFVLVDDNMESVAELMLIDDDSVLASQTILEGLDDELNEFFNNLLSE